MNRHSHIALAAIAGLSMSVAVHAASDPTLHEVYKAASTGHLSEAQNMMAQVLRDHPNSGKAHYVQAEILAKEGQLAQAKTELDAAEHLTPGLPFAKPEAVSELKQIISGNHPVVQSASSTATGHQGGVSWFVILLGLALAIGIIMIVRIMRRNSGATVISTPYGSTYGPSAPIQTYSGAGYAPPMAQPTAGTGSGVLGGLATGAAVGAGMIAGEELIRHFTDGNHQDASQPASSSWDPPTVANDLGGNDFGISGGSSWDDSSSGSGDW